MRAIYPYVVKFDRYFVDGNLAGMTYEGMTTSFPTENCARVYARNEGRTLTCCVTKKKYINSNFIFMWENEVKEAK